MVRFVIEQRWITEDGTLRGEVVEISDDGISGSVEIIDEMGDRNTFHGTAEAFQLSGNWRVVV